MRGTFASNEDSDSALNLTEWTSSQVKDQTGTPFGKRIFGPEDRATQIRFGIPCTNQLLGSRAMQESYRVGWPLVDQNPVNANQFWKQGSGQEKIFHFSSRPVSMMRLIPPSDLTESGSIKLPIAKVNDYDGMHGLEVKQQPGHWLLPRSSAENSRHPMALNLDHLCMQHDEKAEGNSNCKLFGISLVSNPVVTNKDVLHTNDMHRPQGQTGVGSEHQHDMVSERLLEHDKCSKFDVTAIGGGERQKPFPVLKLFSVDSPVNLPGGSTRRSIEVISFLTGSACFDL